MSNLCEINCLGANSVMQIVKSNLEEREREVKAFIRLLDHVNSRLIPRMGTTRRGDLPNKDSFTAMKATAFLMLYNIVEATVVATIKELYETIEFERCLWKEVTPKIREVWLAQKYDLPKATATPDTYKNTARKLIDDTADGAILKLNPKALSLGGNIGAQVARDVCHKHGCSLSIHKRAKGGCELDTVKEQRNGLAHGDLTFVECGREYDVSDIERISKECFLFLKGFIRSFERFVAKKHYRLAKSAREKRTVPS